MHNMRYNYNYQEPQNVIFYTCRNVAIATHNFIVTNHSAFCLNIPKKHSSSHYPALVPQISTFWITRSVRDLHRHWHCSETNTCIMCIIMCRAALPPIVDTTVIYSYELMQNFLYQAKTATSYMRCLNNNLNFYFMFQANFKQNRWSWQANRN